jgi:hypothetical protein
MNNMYWLRRMMPRNTVPHNPPIVPYVPVLGFDKERKSIEDMDEEEFAKYIGQSEEGKKGEDNSGSNAVVVSETRVSFQN